MGLHNRLIFPHQHNKRSFIKRNSLKIATWNVNGLNNKAQIILNLNKHDILGLQEIHKKHFNEKYLNETFENGQNEFILSQTPPENDKHSGVAFVVSKKIKKCIISHGSPSSRIVWIKLDSNYNKILVINGYIPYNNHKTVDYKETIEKLRVVIHNNTSNNDVIILMGDLNGKIGKNPLLTGHYAIHHTSNVVGKAIEKFMTEFNLFAVSTNFRNGKHKNGVTFKRKNNFGQIDYILCSKRFKTSFKKCNVNWSWTKLKYGKKRDHGKVQAIFRFHFKATKKKTFKNNDIINTDYIKIDKFKSTLNNNIEIELKEQKKK
eukprot:448149_1